MRAQYRTYDHRLKALVAYAGDAEIAVDLGIPRSTAHTWIKQGVGEVITHDLLDIDTLQLQARILELERQNLGLQETVNVLQSLVDIRDAKLNSDRLPDGKDKAGLLAAVDRAALLVPIESILERIGMTAARYYRWRKMRKACQLTDYPSCPKRSPSQITTKEMLTIRSMVIDPKHSHIPISNLAVMAARLGIVIASVGTWYKQIKKHGWIRPKTRLYRRRHRTGIRAKSINEIWHIDVTQIRLVNNLKVYIHACIDNYSRYILAYRVSYAPTAIGCRELIETALLEASASGTPVVMCDSGSENLNREVDKLVNSDSIIRQVAQIDIEFSNSMIEAFFRSLKVNYLYNLRLTDYTTVEKYIDFYIDQHNRVIPHSALKGATPQEIFTGTWTDQKILEMKSKFIEARTNRIMTHQKQSSCGNCDSLEDLPISAVA